MKIHKEGTSMIVGSFIITIVIAALLFYYAGINVWTIIVSCIPLILTVFFISFFRDPVRHPVGDETHITAPADGKIVIIKEVEESEYFHHPMLQISVFMSFFNVHINWIPMTGIISFFKYHPGNYLAAWHPKSSVKNERTTVVLKNSSGVEILCRQIAGLFARRVVCYAEYEKKFKAGEQLGFIKFGSRADVFLPIGTKVNVKIGDKVTGSETVIAELQPTPAPAE